MAQLPMQFNPAAHRPHIVGGGQLPVSDPKSGHLVEIYDSSIAPTKNDNNSGFIKFDVRVIEGEHTGATGSIRLNLYNQSQKAREIAEQQFTSLHLVCGKSQGVRDTVELHAIPFRVIVMPQLENPQYTEVKGFKDRNGNDPSPVNAQQQQAPVGFQQPPQQAQPQQAYQQPAQGFGQAQQPAQGFQQPAQDVAAGWGQAPQGAQGAAPAWATGGR